MAKNPYVIPVRVYFPNDERGKKTVKRLERISKLSGISMSRVATFAIREGIAAVEARLVGSDQLPKMEVPKK